MTEPLRLRLGTQKYLVTTLQSILTAANADIAAKVVSNAAPPVFTVQIGDIPNPSSPVLSVAFNGAPRPERTAQSEIFRTIRFLIHCYVPLAGDCTPMNYEMALVTIADHFDNLFLDDTKTQLPRIDAGLIPNLQAFQTDLGDQRSLWPMKLADNVTEVHGWTVPWSATYSIRTR